jgi:thiol-disulfide isomerase/thioredoxin
MFYKEYDYILKPIAVMIKKILLLVLLSFFALGYSQDTTKVFSDALRLNIGKYIAQSNHAFEKRDLVEGKRLFDSLVRYKLVGTKFDNFTLKSYDSKKVVLKEINKPIYLITFSSWCVFNNGDVPALNKLAEEYKKDVQIILLFWDKKENLKKIASKFKENIKICYANESYDQDSRIVATLKHTLGFPTSYFIDEKQKVVNINRIISKYNPKATLDECFRESYENFNEVIKKSLSDNMLNPNDKSRLASAQ